MVRLLTIKGWEEHLMPLEMEAIKDYFYKNESTEERHRYSSNEVLEAIVKWNGGIASAYHIKAIIERVYGIEVDKE